MIIVGLGNPGIEYELNRHNVGFLFLDWLLDQLTNNTDKVQNVEFSFNKKFNLQYCQLHSSDLEQKYQNLFGMKDLIKKNDKIFLLKPMSFMNLSGAPVASFLSYYKLSIENLVVAYDDIDVEFGKVKFKKSGSSGGHNGIGSISKTIGNDYYRIRIGVGRPEMKADVPNYVLSNFSKTEISNLSNIFETILI